MTGYDLLELTQKYLDIVGDAYWYKELGVLGIPSKLWLLPAQNVEIKRTSTGEIYEYLYQPSMGGSSVHYRPDTILHFSASNMADPYGYGMSVAKALWINVKMANSMQSLEYSLTENKAIPGTIVSPKADIGTAEADRLEMKYKKKLRKGGNGGLIVSDYAVDVKSFATSPKDAELLASYRVTTDEICNAFGVPLSYLSKDSNLANLTASEIQLSKLAIRPRLKKLESQINKLVSSYDARLFAAFDDPVKDDLEVQSKIHVAYKNAGVLTTNEIREELGYEPIDETEVEQPVKSKDNNDKTDNR
jgi:HK97 family phage portal protein